MGQASAELYSANEEFREAVTQIAALDPSLLAAAYAAELAALPPGRRRDAPLNLLQLSVIYNLDLEPYERECGGSICVLPTLVFAVLRRLGFDRDPLSLYQKPEPELEEASNLSGKPSRITLAKRG